MKGKKLAVLLVMLICILSGVSGIIVPNTALAAPAATKIKISKKMTVYVGKKKKLKVTSTPKSAKPKIQWKTSNKKVATVNKKGIVKGVKKGKATITASVKGNKKVKSVKCKVTVSETTEPVKAVTATGVNVEESVVSLDLGSTAQIKATVSPDNTTNKDLSYNSYDPDVATVTDNMITAVGVGRAEIEVKTKDGSGKTAKVIVHVKPVVATSIEPAALTVGLKESETSQLEIEFTPANTTNKVLTFSSNKPDIVSVSPTGRITGIKQGTAEITAMTTDGSYKSTVVEVVVNPLEATDIDVTISNTTLMQGDKMQINASVIPANASVKELKFTSSDEYAATVSNTGLVTALAQGFTTITVETTDGSNLKQEFNLTIDLDRSDMPKVIITSDGEVDDQNSLIHFLLYTNEVNCLGIVHTSSQFHWEGSPNAHYEAGKSPYRWPGRDWVPMLIDAYEEIYPNLRMHDNRYPTPNYLRSISKLGNIGFRDDMSGPTDGSNLIKDAILKHVNNNESGILYVTAWGGPNTFAMALKQIEDEYKNQPGWTAFHDKISEKVACSAFGSQDSTKAQYVTPIWPDIKWLNGSADYGYNASGNAAATFTAPYEKRQILGGTWMRENIDYGHGALLDHYVTWGDGYALDFEPPRAQFGNWDMANSDKWFSNGKYPRYEFLSEGDSPSVFYFFDNGLRNWENGKVNVNWGAGLADAVLPLSEYCQTTLLRLLTMRQPPNPEQSSP